MCEEVLCLPLAQGRHRTAGTVNHSHAESHDMQGTSSFQPVTDDRECAGLVRLPVIASMLNVLELSVFGCSHTLTQNYMPSGECRSD